MKTLAIVLEAPEQLALRELSLAPLGAGDVLVEVEHSAISTGTERLLWSGRMPAFPGMGYPLVPGYESVGRVLARGEVVRGEAVRGEGVRGEGVRGEAVRGEAVAPDLQVGARVFVPGASCFGAVRGLFGGAASHLVVSASRVVPLDGVEAFAREPELAVLLALAATAGHALAAGPLPDLIVGHGALGRLLARWVCGRGGSPVVWETQAQRISGSTGYRVLHPDEDPRRDYRCICDVSGDAALLDGLIARLARGGEIVLAGFYAQSLSFAFAPAFMREARLRVAAEWQPDDLRSALAAVRDGTLSLHGIITHRAAARDAAGAYRTAFSDPACLKMLIEWRSEPI